MMEAFTVDWDVFWWAIFWSSTFFGEIKIGIPYALTNGMPIWMTYIVCCSANLLAFPITIYFLDTVHEKLLVFKPYKKWMNRIILSARRKTKNLIDKRGFFGIAIFVMFPAPMTGAYIGTIACWLFGMDRRKSFFAVMAGTLLAGILLITLTLFAEVILGYLSPYTPQFILDFFQ